MEDVTASCKAVIGIWMKIMIYHITTTQLQVSFMFSGGLLKRAPQYLQEEETLLNEMEVTGQAFEDMQEQNIRLIQQLREKDDANFKLMSERIKSNQIHQIANEERNVLQEQVELLVGPEMLRGLVAIHIKGQNKCVAYCGFSYLLWLFL